MNQRNIVTYITYVLLGTLLGFNLHGMETVACVASDFVVDIVDHNENQSINMVMEQGPAIVGVFGATPRYSLFERYICSLKEDYTHLLTHYKKGKRLKGVDGGIKQFVASIESHSGLQALNNIIMSSMDSELMELFFAAGLDHKILEENIGILLKKAQLAIEEKCSTKDDNRCLAHLLMPSYFADLPHLQNNPKAPEIVHAFLKKAALFYQQLYRRLASQISLKIYIIVPRLDYFMAMINQGALASKFDANLAVVQKELIELVGGGSNGFVLMDQDVGDLKPMVEILHQRGMQRVAGAEIPITNSAGYPTTIFNPYVLKPEKQHAYHNSPLFNNQLLEYAQKKHKENFCE